MRYYEMLQSPLPPQRKGAVCDAVSPQPADEIQRKDLGPRFDLVLLKSS